MKDGTALPLGYTGPIGPLAADGFGPAETTRCWRVPALDNLDCLAARFETYEFTTHAHDSHGVAVILDGAQSFRWRGTSQLAPAGSLEVMNPGEPHDGRPAETSFAYRTLYPSVTLMRRLAVELSEGRVREPVFGRTVIHDPPLARRVAAMHRTLEASSGSLAHESAFVDVMSALLWRHADLMPAARTAGGEGPLVHRLRDYLDAHVATDVSLADLARVGRRSRFSVLRSFRNSIGMTPHAYLLNRRVEQARRLLASGCAIADTALDCGFFDQSHFTRVFKRFTGLTPGQYRCGGNIVQDRPAGRC
jgi:AraC-like DNA-binding protein